MMAIPIVNSDPAFDTEHTGRMNWPRGKTSISVGGCENLRDTATGDDGDRSSAGFWLRFKDPMSWRGNEAGH